MLSMIHVHPMIMFLHLFRLLVILRDPIREGLIYTDIVIASYNLDVMSHPVYYIQTIPTDIFLVVMTIYYSSHTVYNGSLRLTSTLYLSYLYCYYDTGDFNSVYTTYLIGSIVNILQ